MGEVFPFEDPRRRCLRVDEWPKADRAAWEAALEPGDLLDGTVGSGHHWCAATREKYRKGYGRWLTFLTCSGRLNAADSPAVRVTQDAVGAYLRELEATLISSWTVWGRIAELLAAVRAMAPDEDWSWLRQIARRIERRVQATRDKGPRLRDPGEIVDWACATMDRLYRKPGERHAPSRYRTALSIALLILCPVRLGNLTMIELDRHLLKGSDGYSLSFAAHEMKARKPFALPVPASLTGYIDHYLAMIRPALLRGRQSPRLWITQYGEPMREKAMHLAITDATRRAFGAPINPHLFRDCAASFVAHHDPRHIGIASPLLGHTDPRTTERHYIQAQQVAAGRRHRASVDALRSRLQNSCGSRREE